MYEHFKNCFLAEIGDKFSTEDLLLISAALDDSISPYELTRKSVDLIPYDFGENQLLKIYLVTKKIEGLSEQTLYNYRIILTAFFHAVRKGPEEVSSNDIRLYLYRYQECRHISNRSLDKIRQVIVGFFIWVNSENYISGNPGKTVMRIKYEVKPRQPLTQIELEYVRRACITARDLAIIEVLFSTACRVSELAILKVSDVNLDTKAVHLFGKGKKHRFSYLNAKAEVALKDYLLTREFESEYLFVSERRPHQPLTKEAIEKIIRKIAERSGITKKLTPHVIRHTSATIALQNGMPVESIQLMLGHAKIDTTMIYAHSDESTVKQYHAHCVI